MHLSTINNSWALGSQRTEPKQEKNNEKKLNKTDRGKV